MKMMSPRDMDRMADDQCYYVPICDHNGGMLNDPVAIKLAQDHYWLSLAMVICCNMRLGLRLHQTWMLKSWNPMFHHLQFRGQRPMN
jgi:dimethylsulfoniopropionate demethylase